MSTKAENTIIYDNKSLKQKFERNSLKIKFVDESTDIFQISFNKNTNVVKFVAIIIIIIVCIFFAKY